MLLSQDEARFPMVPALNATLGVKGHRPVVGNWDCKHLLYVFAVADLATVAVHANLVDSPKDAKARTGKEQDPNLVDSPKDAKARTGKEQDPADAGGVRRRLRHAGRMYPAGENRRVVILIDNAPWN